MKFETYNRHETFTVTFNSNSGSKIIKIWEPKIEPVELANLGTVQHVIKNGFINSIRIMSKITSIEQANLPTLTIEQSRTERLGLVRNTEWNSPRKHLNLHYATANGGWVKIGALSLLRIDPFRVFDLLEYFTKDIALGLGSYGAIGLSVENAGYGLLQGDDEIVCFGNATTEVVIIPQEIEPIKQTYPYGAVIGTESVLFIPEINNKKQVTLTNAGEHDIFIGLGRNAELNKGLCLKANGGSYEFNRSNHPTDLAIYAIAVAPSLLSGLVAV